MKTYTKQVELPRLVISHDDWSPSPRKMSDGIGVFVTQNGKYESPDGTDNMLYQIMMETEVDANNTEHHIELMKEKIEQAYQEDKKDELCVTDIYPITRYEHSGIAYKRGVYHGFDYTPCGFYFVTVAGLNGEKHTQQEIEEIIDSELSQYTSWCNGEIYEYTLYDENGEEIENCGGFYSIDEIKEVLPEEWKDEDLNEYITQ